MHDKLSRDALVSLVRRIMDAEGSEQKLEDMHQELERNVVDPNVLDYIFYSDEELTAEQIVDKALAYQPRLFGS